MNAQDLNFMTTLTVELIRVGLDQKILIRAMQLPKKIWLNWEDTRTGLRGTAQIDGDVVNGESGGPTELAESFINYIRLECAQHS